MYLVDPINISSRYRRKIDFAEVCFGVLVQQPLKKHTSNFKSPFSKHSIYYPILFNTFISIFIWKLRSNSPFSRIVWFWKSSWNWNPHSDSPLEFVYNARNYHECNQSKESETFRCLSWWKFKTWRWESLQRRSHGCTWTNDKEFCR